MIKTPYDAFISNMEIVDTSSYSAEDKARLRSNIFEAVSIRAAYREGFLAGSTLLREAVSKFEHIAEYWNGGRESAVDAIEEAREVAEKFVAAAKDAGITDERDQRFKALKEGVAESTESFKEERR